MVKNEIRRQMREAAARFAAEAVGLKKSSETPALGRSAPARIQAGSACSARELVASEIVCRKLAALPEFAAARTVLCYMALQGEVSLDSLLRDNAIQNRDSTDCAFLKRVSSGKRFAIPRVVGEELELRVYDPSELVAGYAGVREPSSEAALVDPSEVDMAIVPGVAFDRNGHRLGHGKGFYDRLLPRLSCPVVGVCFSYRLLDTLPVDPWDHPVDLVVTDLGV